MEIILSLRSIFAFLVVINQKYETSCYQTKRDADEITHINPDVCLKTHENDTACSITNKCKPSSQSCPLIQSELGVIMCTSDNRQKYLKSTSCFRFCHDEGFEQGVLIGMNPKCTVVYDDEQSLNRNGAYRFRLKTIAKYATYVGPSNLPSDSDCKALNVPNSLCLTFTKYRVLLCGSKTWKQAQCYMGNCMTNSWPMDSTLACQYASVPDGVALIPSPKYSGYCVFLCVDNSGACSKTNIQMYANTDKGRELMLSIHNFTMKDWKKLEEL